MLGQHLCGENLSVILSHKTLVTYKPKTRCFLSTRTAHNIIFFILPFSSTNLLPILLLHNPSYESTCQESVAQAPVTADTAFTQLPFIGTTTHLSCHGTRTAVRETAIQILLILGSAFTQLPIINTTGGLLGRTRPHTHGI